jgi:hypothetical protein
MNINPPARASRPDYGIDAPGVRRAMLFTKYQGVPFLPYVERRDGYANGFGWRGGRHYGRFERWELSPRHYLRYVLERPPQARP